MPQKLHDLTVKEVSLVDRPSCAEVVDGKKIPRARIALFKRDKADFDAVLKAAKGIKFVVGFPKGGGGSKVQSVLFDRAEWDEAKARKWLTDNDFNSGKIDTTEGSFRFRQEDPEGYERFRTIEPGQTAKGEEEMALTLKDIEDRVVKQDETIADQGKEITALKAERETLVRENELVLKMNKRDRKAYASLDVEKRKAFMGATDDKKKQMLDEACANKREEELVAAMDETLRSQFEKAGPVEKAALLEVTEKRLAKAEAVVKGKKPPFAEDPGDSEAEPDEDDAEKAAKAAQVAKAEEETLIAKREKAAVEDRLTKTEAELDRIKKRERLVSFAKRAEDELPHTAGSPEEKGDMLMKMADAFGGPDSDMFKKCLGQLKAADSALAVHFREVGKSGGAIRGEQALEAKAQEIAKRDHVSVEKAYTKVATEHPQLWFEYETERRQQANRQ